MVLLPASEWAAEPDACYDTLQNPVIIEDGFDEGVPLRFWYDSSFLRFEQSWRGWRLCVRMHEIA